MDAPPQHPEEQREGIGRQRQAHPIQLGSAPHAQVDPADADDGGAEPHPEQHRFDCQAAWSTLPCGAHGLPRRAPVPVSGAGANSNAGSGSGA
ncbi:hypothetical protein ACFPRL_15220 [Pseudoclavibacter helvolus]